MRQRIRLRELRLKALRKYELSLSGEELLTAGVDEAGRGPLAGPVVAGAVILRKKEFEKKIDDSKRLSERERQEAFREIKKNCHIGIGIVDNRIIDEINIFQAARLAMKKALASLKIKPDLLLVDGNMKLDVPLRVNYIIKGDQKCLSIACASIVAKVTRDAIMNAYHKQFPVYGFRFNKGYPTKAHRRVLTRIGPSPIHRRSFKFKPILNSPGLVTA